MSEKVAVLRVMKNVLQNTLLRPLIMLWAQAGDLRTVIAAPFLTRWVFDCEMIARYAAILAATKPPLPTPAAHPWLP